jgi:hypothetical protein
MNPELVEQLAKRLHEIYEMAAGLHGWETNPRSRVPWEEVPEANKNCTRAVARECERQIRWNIELRSRDAEPKYTIALAPEDYE